MNLDNRKSEVINKGLRFIENLRGEVFILGTNKYGINVAHWLECLNFPIKGFINDFIECKFWDSYKIFNNNYDYSDATLINCIVEGKTIDAENRILECNPKIHIDYFCLQAAFPSDLMEVTFLDDTDSISNDFKSYDLVHGLLQDNQSKVEFEKILNFRLNRDIKNLRNFKFRPEDQYFESFFSLNNSPSFIDGGGFDGVTSKHFSELYPNYKSIYFFEPSKYALSLATKTLQNLERISFFNKGLWNKSGTILFDDSLGSASRYSQNGNLVIDTVSIDQIANGGIDFIKLDIEGAEYNALIGAEITIKKNKPVLAICVYHNQSDFFKIPNLIISYNPNYRIFFRHYTQGVYESVMYFVN